MEVIVRNRFNRDLYKFYMVSKPYPLKDVLRYLRFDEDDLPIKVFLEGQRLNLEELLLNL